ncbi:MAG: hypothetical protein IT447_01010 [Phycisphaerales bacterium]|jgi:hypothetical protein|nr:hypothetical protein [Phycisphaerales bacterium]
MADEPHVIRGINWRETFPFTNIFRSFRVAIHPSKILLALVGLLLIYIGGRVLDGLWLDRHLAVDGEIALYQQSMNRDDPARAFEEARKEARQKTVENYAGALAALDKSELKTRTDRLKAAREGEYFGELKKYLLDERKRAIESADKAYANAKPKNDEERQQAKKNHDENIREIYDSAADSYRMIDSIHGRGLFITLFDYEVSQVNNVMQGVYNGNWLVAGGVVGSIVNFFTVGPSWLLSQHLLYFVLFTIWFLIVWAIFGGAVARIAAVHVARDEKISVRQALKFSAGKVLSFIFAPIIPLVIILVLGLLVTVVALLGNIPWIGPILIGVPFVLALAAGFVMTLVLIGTVAGFDLMYPTIAVEGSDAFDAISRSFSYIYARPWRLLFYTAVAIIYGALTYLFVRLFIYMVLGITHSFVDLGMFAQAATTRDLWTTMWPAPTSLWKLPYDPAVLSMNMGESVGSWFVALWVYLTIALIGAFAISFYFSANTIIYYLMRREVDATELDDVYVEQLEDDFSEAAPVTATPAAATTPAATESTPPPAQSSAPTEEPKRPDEPSNPA